MTMKGTVNWIITRGAGFIGANLVNSLIQGLGHRVRILENLSSGQPSYIKEIAQGFRICSSDELAD